jgi:hypothetical protein
MLRRHFGAPRRREAAPSATRSALLLRLGTALAALWLILFAAWEVELARLANSAESEDVRLVARMRSTTTAPRHDAVEAPGIGTGTKTRPRPRPGVREVPRPFSELTPRVAMPMARADRCFADSTPVGAFALATPDLRCDLAEMAASQRRTGYVYVGPR